MATQESSETMAQAGKGLIGFTCAYTPLALIDAAGFTPYRILPLGDSPDRAGTLLHDNICPHVKRILDRAMSGDLPDLSGLVFMNSCDAMRRLAETWIIRKPEERVAIIDLPSTSNGMAVNYLTGELRRLAAILSRWTGKEVTKDAIVRSIGKYNELNRAVSRLADAVAGDMMPIGSRALQEIYNRSVTGPPDETLREITRLMQDTEPAGMRRTGIPVYLFGNVLPDPAAFDLFEECGCFIAGRDLCTAGRQLAPVDVGGSEDVISELAAGLIRRPACARTLQTEPDRSLTQQVLDSVGSSGARGVIVHIMKFCDPYLARLPGIRDALQEAGFPVLVLEGDCTTRSLGQYRTRIEAFVEMLGENPL